MMKKLICLLMVCIFALPSALAFAKDVYIKGYFRKDGTYVRPHIRKSPNQFKWDNYGPSRRDSELMNPRARDNDGDGMPNYLDRDDDNDSIFDDNDSFQYGGSNRGWPNGFGTLDDD